MLPESISYIQKENIEYKKTVIGNIPENWSIKRISEVGIVSSGGTPDTSNYEYWNGDIAWCTPTDISALKSKYLYKTKTYLTESGIKNSSAKLLPIQSLIICTRASIGKAAITRIPVSTNQGFKNITNFKDITVEFLYYRILFDKHRLLKIANGSTFLEISKTDFDKLQIPLPPLPEQQKIVEILSTCDKAIELCEKCISELKKRNKGLAQQLLNGKKKLKGFEGEWKEYRLGDIARRITRRNEELDDTVVTISAQRGFVLQEDFFNKRVASETLSNYYLIHKGEFAYNKSYSNGYPMGAFKRLDDFPKAVVTTLYICFQLKKGVNSNYMVFLFEAGLMIPRLMKIAQEGGRAHGLLNIGLADFFNLKLTLPDLNEQEAIASVLEKSDQEFKLIQKRLKTLKEQKKGLMQKLLTGEVRVSLNPETIKEI